MQKRFYLNTTSNKPTFSSGKMNQAIPVHFSKLNVHSENDTLSNVYRKNNIHTCDDHHSNSVNKQTSRK